MLTARASRLRDWTLFAAAAIAPAVAVGILGLRAIENEAAGALREVSLELTTASAQISRDIEKETARATAALAAEAIAGDPSKAAATLGKIAPPFADAVLLAPDRSLLVPAPPRGTLSAPAPPRCQTLVNVVSSPSADASARRELLASCAEARTTGGRWLWPVVALDAIRRGEASADAVPAWIEAHASVLSEAERTATSIEVREALSGPARDQALAALAIPWSRRDALLAELRRAGAEAAMRAPPDRSGLVTFRAGSSTGALRALEDGKLAGFVIYKESLEAWFNGGARAVPPGVRVQVIASAEPPRAPRIDELPTATAMLAPELGVLLLPADPAAVARHAAVGRRLLAGIGGFTTALAFGLAALLFARMRAARRLGELRTDFVAAVSHELRTPIASMRMLAELLEEGRLEQEEHREVFEALGRESRRLGETVDRLLGFSRMAAGRMVLDRSPGSVAGAVSASIDTFEERNPEMSKVERELDRAIEASIDPGQIRLAVDNLLVNARKYAPGGAPYRVSVKRDKGGVAITVMDRGPGIARRDQRRIFEPFERADDRLSRATEGSGIGLSLVRHVAEAHGGRAFVESEAGRGAAFTIWIPCSTEDKR